MQLDWGRHDRSSPWTRIGKKASSLSSPSHSDLAALCKCTYSKNDVAKALSPSLKRRGWRLLHTYEDEASNLRVVAFLRGASVVLAARGTELASAKNLKDDLRLALDEMPSLATPLSEYVRSMGKDYASERAFTLACVRFRALLSLCFLLCSSLPLLIRLLASIFLCLLSDSWLVNGCRNQLFLTGHSLGAAAMNMVFIHLVQEDIAWLARIKSVVLFENPGVPHDVITGLQSNVGDKYESVSSKVTEYFGAPNAINMACRHMGGQQVRVKITHVQPKSLWFRTRCLLGSLTRAGMVFSAVAWIVGSSVALIPAKASNAAIVAAEKASFASSLTPASNNVVAGTLNRLAQSSLKVFGLLGSFYGIADLSAWTIHQHDLEAMHTALRDRRCVIVKKWPDSLSVRAIIHQVAGQLLPFNPANEGIFTMGDREKIIETRVEMLLNLAG